MKEARGRGPALVLDAHHSLNIIEALSREGVEVIGSDCLPVPFGILPSSMSRFIVNPNYNPPGAYLDFLAAAVEETGASCLMPCTTKTVGIVSRNLERLNAPSLVPSPRSYEMAVDRLELREAARKAGVPCPRTRAFEEPGDVDGFPVVSKPRFEKGGATGMSIIRSAAGINPALELGRSVGPLVLQDYIPGSSTSMRTCNLLFDSRSRPRAIFTMRKIREHPQTGGPTLVGVSSRDGEVARHAVNLLREMDWRGVAEVEFKVDPRDGEPKLMEVNPRFWAYLRLPVACGVNFPHLLFRLCTGEDFEPVEEYRTGVGYVNARYRARSMVRLYRQAPRDGGLVFDYHPMEPYLLSSTLVEARRRFRDWTRRRRRAREEPG